MLEKLLAAFLIVCCVSCSQHTPSDSAESHNESTWVEKDYRIEELIVLFQEMISPELFKQDNGEEKWPWLCEGMTWQEFKVEVADSMASETRFFKCQNEPGSITPGIYFCTVVKTADSEGEFCKDDWTWTNWIESMVTNYSDAKCAQLMLNFVETALLDAKMNKDWQQNKSHWTKAVKKIADSYQ